MVDPRTLVEPPVDGEDHADRRVEEDEVAVVLGAHLVGVAAADAEQAVEREAHGATARQIRLEELVGIIAVFVPRGLFGPHARIEDRVAHFLLLGAGDDIDLPGLHVGARRRARGHAQNVLYRLVVDRGRQEGADRAARQQRLVHDLLLFDFLRVLVGCQHAPAFRYALRRNRA